ncbi:hypothetical protein R20943_02295 [Paraburkholderia aspalathi]|nr:hypothetical protein R20943_02295 [Paraburkholderia aspalathi]
MSAVSENLSLVKILRVVHTKVTPGKPQATFYQTLLTGPATGLWSHCDDRPDVTSIAILGYN